MSKRVINWTQAMLEVGLVFLGLLLAFTADRWWEAQQEKAVTRSYVERLASDFAESRRALEATAGLHEDIVEAAQSFLAVVASGNADSIQAEVPELVPRIFAGSTTSLVTGTLDEMKSTGSLDLLNEDVRRALAAFDGLRLGSFAITEQAEILQWIQRTQPYLNANVRSDVFVSEADRQRLSVPRSPFNEHTLDTAMAPELWNVVVHRIIYAD